VVWLKVIEPKLITASKTIKRKFFMVANLVLNARKANNS